MNAHKAHHTKCPEYSEAFLRGAFEADKEVTGEER